MLQCSCLFRPAGIEPDPEGSAWVENWRPGLLSQTLRRWTCAAARRPRTSAGVETSLRRASWAPVSQNPLSERGKRATCAWGRGRRPIRWFALHAAWPQTRLPRAGPPTGVGVGVGHAVERGKNEISRQGEHRASFPNFWQRGKPQRLKHGLPLGDGIQLVRDLSLNKGTARNSRDEHGERPRFLRPGGYISHITGSKSRSQPRRPRCFVSSALSSRASVQPFLP